MAALRKRLAERAPEASKAVEELRRLLPGLVAMLVGEFQVRRVVLFGSLAAGVPREGSDIDLAVEGLRPARYFAALARAASLAGRDVDIVPLEEASPRLAEIIAQRGEVLYES